MRHVLAVLAALALAVPAQAQTFQFQTGGYFTGAPANIALDVQEPPVAVGIISASGLHFDAASGNYIGTGHVVLAVNGLAIDDPSASFAVVPGPTAGEPTCDNVRVRYVAGVVISGNWLGTPYALASGVQRFDPGAGCPIEVLQFNGATGQNAVRSLDLRQFDARIRVAARSMIRQSESFGALKAGFR